MQLRRSVRQQRRDRMAPQIVAVTSVGSSLSALLEQPDYQQENHRANDGVDDCRDEPTNDNKTDQR